MRTILYKIVLNVLKPYLENDGENIFYITDVFRIYDKTDYLEIIEI